MSNDIKDPRTARYATLKIAPTNRDLAMASIDMPSAFSADDFAKVARQAYDVISKLTNHPCLSGKFRVVVNHQPYVEAIQVGF